MKNLWELRYVIAMLIVIIIVCALAWSYPWLLTVPVALIALSYPIYIVRRSRSLKNRGYFLVEGKEGATTFEEVADGEVRSIALPSGWTGPGEIGLSIPTVQEWKATAPDWAADRRDEIFTKVITMWFTRDITYPSDWPATQDDKMKKQNKSEMATPRKPSDQF